MEVANVNLQKSVQGTEAVSPAISPSSGPWGSACPAQPLPAPGTALPGFWGMETALCFPALGSREWVQRCPRGEVGQGIGGHPHLQETGGCENNPNACKDKSSGKLSEEPQCH